MQAIPVMSIVLTAPEIDTVSVALLLRLIPTAAPILISNVLASVKLPAKIVLVPIAPAYRLVTCIVPRIVSPEKPPSQIVTLLPANSINDDVPKSNVRVDVLEERNCAILNVKLPSVSVPAVNV